MCANNWAKDISTLTLETIVHRKFNRHHSLPLPSDIKALTQFLAEESKQILNIKSTDDYKHAVEISLSRLLTFNKRTPGELEALRCVYLVYFQIFMLHMLNYHNVHHNIFGSLFKFDQSPLPEA